MYPTKGATPCRKETRGTAIVWAAVAAAVYYSWPTRDTARHGHATVIVAIAANIANDIIIAVLVARI